VVLRIGQVAAELAVIPRHLAIDVELDDDPLVENRLDLGAAVLGVWSVMPLKDADAERQMRSGSSTVSARPTSTTPRRSS